MSELKRIAIDKLHPHPDNPRVVMREDVLSAILAGMNGEYPKKHAIHVRPLDDGYQILAGHTRTEAARQKGFSHIWAWVEELDDDAAFMFLITSNSQGELKPLEIGIHAEQAVSQGRGGHGAGDLKKYADLIGKAKNTVAQYARAAKVYLRSNCADIRTVRPWTDLAYHLEVVARLPEKCWRSACEWLGQQKDASVADVEERVSLAMVFRKEFDPGEWNDWLPRDRCTLAIFTQEQTESGFRRLLDIANEAAEKLADHDDLAAQWETWLIDNAGGDSWDAKKVRAKRDELEDIAWQREQAGMTEDDRFQIHACDFRKAPIEPDTFDFIITDPPYPEEFIDLYGDLSEFAARTLKPGGSLFVMCGHSYLDRLLSLLGKHLTYHWTLAYLTPGGQAVQCWDRKVNTFWKPVFWFVKGEYQGDWIGDVVKSAVNDNDKEHHHWGQSESGMTDLIERVSRPGDLLCDPFLGGGTTGVVAMRLGRKFVGMEIDAAVAETARQRMHKEINPQETDEAP